MCRQNHQNDMSVLGRGGLRRRVEGGQVAIIFGRKMNLMLNILIRE